VPSRAREFQRLDLGPMARLSPTFQLCAAVIRRVGSAAGAQMNEGLKCNRRPDDPAVRGWSRFYARLRWG